MTAEYRKADQGKTLLDRRDGPLSFILKEGRSRLEKTLVTCQEKLLPRHVYSAESDGGLSFFSIHSKLTS